MVTTQPPVAFAFHTSYVTKDDQNTTIMVACGPHVTSNLITGLHFIQMTWMTINFSDNVAEYWSLDCLPFPIEIKQALLVPLVATSSIQTYKTELYKAFVTVLDNMKHQVACVYTRRPNSVP